MNAITRKTMMAFFLMLVAVMIAAPELSAAGKAGKGISTKNLAELERIRDVFLDNCSACHGEDGVPMMPGAANFAKGERMDKSDAELLKVISKGKKGIEEGIEMPAWEEELSTEDQKKVLSYIRVLSGDRLFQDKCTGCHGTKGVPPLPASIPKNLEKIKDKDTPLAFCTSLGSGHSLTHGEVVHVVKFLRNMPGAK